MKLFRLLLLFIISAVLSFAAAGKFAAVGGEVTIHRGDSKLVAITGQEVAQSDRIITGSNGRAQIVFEDKSLVTIGKNSEFSIEEYAFDNKSREGKASFGMVQGAFRAVTGQIGKTNPQSFQLKTRTATIGIRGTQILAQISQDNELIACTEGGISVTANGGTVDVPTGSATTVSANTPPTPPQAYSQEQVQSLADSAGGGAAQVANPDTFVIDGDDDTSGITQSDDVVLNSGNTNANTNEATETTESEEATEATETAETTTTTEAAETTEAAPANEASPTPEATPVNDVALDGGFETIAPPENSVQDIRDSKGSDTTNNVANEIIREVEQIAPPIVELPTPPPPPPAPVWDYWSTDPLLTTATTTQTQPAGTNQFSLSQTVDPYLGWGLLVPDTVFLNGDPAANQIVGGYINGVITDPSVVQGMLGGISIGTYVQFGTDPSAGGGVIDGVVKYNDGTFARIDSINQDFDLRINFSNPTNALSGSMEFTVGGYGGDYWNLAITGSATRDGISGSLATVSGGNGAGNGASGTLQGKFYGSGVETVGGTFKVTKPGAGGATVDGMFIGKR
ncbi:hypothetical protein AGMMS50229_05460 [Campylobacterota bacterium]|nr:hypothetical protein AGMMS50229_05460 [Campylobacterota bacterium]